MKTGGGIYRLYTMLRKAWAESISKEEYVEYLRSKGVRIGNNVNFRFPAHTQIDITRPCLVELGCDLDINDNFTILTHDFATFVFRGYYKDFVNSSGKVTIGNNIVFGRDVTILKGVTIGDNCIIGAGSIVSKSIPANSVAVGVPAKVICSLDDYYQKRKELQKKEALEYAKDLAKVRGGVDNLQMEDFTEEWVLFLSEEEYHNNDVMKQLVDFRLKDKIDIHEFLNRPHPYANFEEFINAIKQIM